MKIVMSPAQTPISHGGRGPCSTSCRRDLEGLRAYTVSRDDGTRSPRMIRFEVLDDGIWALRWGAHRLDDPGTQVRDRQPIGTRFAGHCAGERRPVSRQMAHPPTSAPGMMKAGSSTMPTL